MAEGGMGSSYNEEAMARNETGEFELVLGNRQLLSLAAIVVILFGVFFTMGFIVGRNSTPFPRAAPEPAPLPSGSVEARPQPSAKPAAQEPAPGAEAGAPVTQPARPDAPPEAPRTEAVKPEAMVEPDPDQSYLQVAAIPRRDAEILVDTLRKKGFPAMLATGPNDLFRVLVGPYKDRDALGKAKSDLEGAGFKNAFVPKL
jgi:cell division septation protein DedD